MEAMRLCVQQLCREEGEGVREGGVTVPDYVLIDGNRLPGNLPDVKAKAVVRVRVMVGRGVVGIMYLIEGASMCGCDTYAGWVFEIRSKVWGNEV